MAVTNPLLQAAVSSARFAKRRSSLSSSRPEIETIIIDVDRTLTTEDSPKVALARLVGKDEAKRIFDSFLGRVLLGKLKLQDIHAAVYGELYSRGFKRADWIGVMEEIERSGGLKTPVIEAFIELSAKEKTTTVLATRASRDSAEWLARRFGFHHAVGSVEMVNGVFQGFETMIGASDNGNGTMTKLTAARKAMEEAGKKFDPARTAVVANDLLDALEMLGSARGVIVLPSVPNRLELLTVRLKLYDVLVREADVGGGLRLALGFY